MSRKNAKCTRCGVIMVAASMVATGCANRGVNKRSFMCPECAKTNERYGARNNKEVGGVENGLRYGIEFESTASTEYFRNMMFRYDYIATHDGSLNSTGERRYTVGRNGWYTESSCEYVSATNKGLKRFAKQFLEIEKCHNEGHVEWDDSCGTHCHISINNMENGEMSMIRAYYNSLFMPLQAVMTANPVKTEEFFGRYFSYSFAREITENTRMREEDHDDRYAWINAVHNSNIEFRLNKFRTADQMLTCIKFETWVVKTILNNFTSKYNSIPRTERKQLAVKTANKLAKKLESIYAEM